MRKFDMASLLGKRYGYTSYLEICTSVTGGTFALVDKNQFPRHIRLMYRCPSGFSDGERIDFSTEGENGDELFEKLMRSGEKFDVVFIDPFHTYIASLRDIVYGLQLVSEHGIVLVHDCYPPNENCASPTQVPGAWCGVTYAAYLDIVLFTQGIYHFTVDSDYGCGIISKRDLFPQHANSPTDPDLLIQWRLLNLEQKYPFFEKHHQQLLNLISPDEFERQLSEGMNGAEYASHAMIDTTINDLILTKISLADTQTALKSATANLQDARDMLSRTNNTLEETQAYLQAIQNTWTWRTHNFITNIWFVRVIYTKIIASLKRR